MWNMNIDTAQSTKPDRKPETLHMHIHKKEYLADAVIIRQCANYVDHLIINTMTEGGYLRIHEHMCLQDSMQLTFNHLL